MVRCFAHTINLAARSVMRQFDVPKGKADAALSEAERALREMMEGLELDPGIYDEDEEGEDDSEDDFDIPDSEVEVDERAGMSESEIEELEASLLPSRMMLAKVNDQFDRYDEVGLRTLTSSASCPIPSFTRQPSFSPPGTRS